MITGIMLWNEPNNLSHWDFQMDPDRRQFRTMIRGAAQAIRELAPDLRLVLGGISPIDPNFIKLLAGHALETIRRRHHCDLRAEQLEDICRTLTKMVG